MKSLCNVNHRQLMQRIARTLQLGAPRENRARTDKACKIEA